jgi:hypothetical protein
MYDYFSTYPGNIYATGSNTRDGAHISADLPNHVESNDPIFGGNGGLIFNWWYSNNGVRIGLTDGYKVKYSLPRTNENNDDLHGLGNEYGANTHAGRGSSAWWHDAAPLQGDCHGGSCSVIGSDHGTHLRTKVQLSSYDYAVFLSTTSRSFECQGKQLSQMMR